MKKCIISLALLVTIILPLLAFAGCGTQCGHSFGDWVVELEPTCSVEGRRSRICLECDEVVYESIPATENHHSSRWVIDREVTCDTDGEKHKICDDCGAEFAKKTVPSAHRFENDLCVSCGRSVNDFFTFSYSDYCYTLTGMTSEAAQTETNIILPSTYNGIVVKVVYEKAFSNNTKLKNITVPEGYTTIYAEAFSHCSSLISVELPESVTKMQYGIFDHCTKLTTVNIPKVITEIPESCFAFCDSLTDTTKIIHENIDTIGRFAFNNCNGFTTIIIPDTVRILRWAAFSNCSNAKSIVVGKRVRRIEYFALDSGEALESVIMMDCDGWIVEKFDIESDDMIDVPITKEDLQNPSTAAYYFKTVHNDHLWKKN